MDILTQMAYEIKQMKTRLANMLQTGKVDAIYADEGLVDVAVDELVLEKIPFFTTRAGADNTYWMPSVGEQGAVLSPSGDMANAMFLPALNYISFPVLEDDENLTVREWEDGAKETYDKANHSYQFQIDENTLRKMNQAEIQDKLGDSHIKQNGSETEIKRAEGSIKIDGSETKIERAAGVLKAILGTNQVELSAILLNLIGAHLFPTGLTTLQSPVGPVMFAPAASPSSAPSPPAGSAPNEDGEVTKTPPSSISGVKIKATSSISLVLPAIPVTTSGGAGTTTPGSYNATVTGTIILEFPARSL